MSSDIVTAEQAAFFHEEGYLCLPGAIEPAWVERLRAALGRLVERSRALTASDGVFDLEVGHSADGPRLRRIAYLDELDEVFWQFASESALPDIIAALIGPDVKFREAMINFKWAKGGQAVKWHQDIPFYPHTNLTPVQVLVALEDITPEQGPLQVIPRSHRGPVFDHYAPDGDWAGYIDESDFGDIALDTARELTGPAGTVTVHHCVTVHGSKRNDSPRGRPALVVGYCAADSMPYTASPYPTRRQGAIVRGRAATHARHDPVSLRLPPDWSGGYTSIFEHQAEA